MPSIGGSGGGSPSGDSGGGGPSGLGPGGMFGGYSGDFADPGGGNSTIGNVVDYGLLVGLPPLGLTNMVAGYFGLDTLGDIISRDLGPATWGTPDAPAGIQGTHGQTMQERGAPPPAQSAPTVPPPFQINPMQVQNDMGSWGQGYQAPQMNPMPMGQSGNQAPFNFGNFFGGGK